METKEFILRRNKLINQLEPNSALLLFAGIPLKSSYDSLHDFIINRNFFYLTGIRQENSALLVVKTLVSSKIYLFIDEFDELKERWTGKKLSIAEACEISGISDVLLRKNLESIIESSIGKGSSFGIIKTLYMDLEADLVIGSSLLTTRVLKDQLIIKYNHLISADAYPLIVKLRMIKSPLEVAAIKTAIKQTHHGLSAIASKIKPGLFEYQLEGLFQFAIKDYAFAPLAFETIIASGVNATILHYPNPKEKINDGVLVLCDLGARFDEYSADISRTLPASKKFNPLQKEIYEVVLKANELIISIAKPGLTTLDLQKTCVEFLTKECLGRGLIKTAEEIGAHYYHNVSHHLGLDTHDPNIREIPLAPGHVITVEPGLYFKEYGIGVRIEDDILITENGAENLSREIPKGLDAVDALKLR